jgi:phosphate/sulfate permease
MTRSTKILACATVVVGIAAAIAMAVAMVRTGKDAPIPAMIFVCAVVGFGIAIMFLGVVYRLMTYFRAAQSVSRVILEKVAPFALDRDDPMSD